MQAAATIPPSMSTLRPSNGGSLNNTLRQASANGVARQCVPLVWGRKLNKDFKRGSVRITNTEARSCSHCDSEKAISITYFESVFVALGIQHAKGMRHIVVWPAWL